MSILYKYYIYLCPWDFPNFMEEMSHLWIYFNDHFAYSVSFILWYAFHKCKLERWHIYFIFFFLPKMGTSKWKSSINIVHTDISEKMWETSTSHRNYSCFLINLWVSSEESQNYTYEIKVTFSLFFFFGNFY